VYVLYGAFLKTGGIIYGINAADPLKNEAPSDGQAAGAYAEGNVFLKRDATAGTGDKLDSAKIGPEGGWDEQPV
jgi:hypothetical protein